MSDYQFPASPGPGGSGGTTWYTGSGAPSTLHNDGDFYLRTSNGDVYKQVSGAWGSPIENLTGPTGATGSAGSAGAAGTNGSTWYTGTAAPSTLHTDGDFYLRTTTGDVYKQVSGAWGSPIENLVGPTGATGGLTSRTTVTKTTASLANGAKEQSTVTMAKTFNIMKIVVDGDCRVRLYSTAAAATADSSRAFTASLLDPPYVGTQHGCIMDLQLVGSGSWTWVLTPEVFGSNAESSPSSSITYIITNLGITRTCQVIFSYISLEV